MKIAVVGTGYVGLVVGACLADIGNDVICIDNNKEKVKLLNLGIIPIYEPGLEEKIKTNVKLKRLLFTSDIKTAVEESTVCFISVGTPQNNDGSCDLRYVISASQDIARYMNGYKIIVNKSTVPVGTAEKVSEIMKSITKHPFDVVSNPEFLKQGNAVYDFLCPDRVIIGSSSKKAINVMKNIYSSFVKPENKIIVMDVKSAEMTKYTANSFLATKISFINEIANLCEQVGANAEMVRLGISTDTRIGNQFLSPGLGYGGSCFPKDVASVIDIARKNNTEISILQAVHNVNIKQRMRFIHKINRYFSNNLIGKSFAIWGLAFKPQTNDMREAPSITIINYLLEHGAKIKAFDPQAIETAKNIFADKITYSKSSYDACKNVDALLLLTEWSEFKQPDFCKIKSLMKTPVIFDGRNQYNSKLLKKYNFEYFCIGKL